MSEKIFDYTYEEALTLTPKFLQDYGNAGWELCAVVPKAGGGYMFYFKMEATK